MTKWVGAAQCVLAALGSAVFAWEAVAGRRAASREVDRPSDGGHRVRRAAFVGLAALASLGAWNFLTFRSGEYLHLWDIYHHYIGAKYFRELGYLRLYECAIAADLEDGHLADAAARMHRNLSTNLLESAEGIASDPTRCTRHFTSRRWRSFKRDVDWFRDALGPFLWEKTPWDHGYNASPVWTLIGGTLAMLVPVSGGGILFLSLLDPLLLLVMWASVGWAFGGRALCLALLFWGTNYPGAFDWMGGAFLRQDWLALTIMAICLVRQKRPVLGGAALAMASLLRLIPLVVAAGLVARLIAGAMRRRPGALAGAWRLALGALMSTAALVPAAALAGADSGAWREFHGRLRLQRETPVIINLGLSTVVAHDPASRLELTVDDAAQYPVERWEEARRRLRDRRAALFFIAAAACLAPLLLAVARASADWAALALGIGAIPILFDLPCYYASILLGLGLLAARRPAWAAALCGLSLVTSIIPLVWSWYDEIFFGASLAVVACVVGMGVAWGLKPDRSREEEAHRAAGRSPDHFW